MDSDERRVRGDAGAERDGTLELLTKLAGSFASRIAGAQDALQRLLSVRADRAQLAIRKRVQMAAVGFLGALAAGTAIVMATVVLVRGIVQGMTLAWGGREWLGSISAALLCFALIGTATAVGLQRWNRRQRIKQEEKYAKLRKQRRD